MPGAPPQAATRRAYASKSGEQRREERRARMLEAGLELVGTRGYRTTTIEALCAAAGVSTRNFYEEFGSREALVIALHDEINAHVFSTVVSALESSDPNDIAERVRVATSAYFEVMTSDRRWAQITLVESVGAGPEVEAHRRQAVDRFVALIEAEAARVAAAGLAPTRDFHLTAVALAGAFNGLINTWTADPNWDETIPSIVAEATRLTLLALTAQAPG